RSLRICCIPSESLLRLPTFPIALLFSPASEIESSHWSDPKHGISRARESRDPILGLDSQQTDRSRATEICPLGNGGFLCAGEWRFSPRSRVSHHSTAASNPFENTLLQKCPHSLARHRLRISVPCDRRRIRHLPRMAG